MTDTPAYPKRLIEVDLPIKRISAFARREKSIRHGHISTLHIWWARRPLAACRAVILAALWPDPADPICPPRFLQEAREALGRTRGTSINVPSDSKVKWDFTNPEHVRAGLLDFIAEFSNWDNSTCKDYLEFARHLVQVAHESLGGAPGTRPLVVDPFAGGGAIPLEALRVGADAFASDLNPVAVLLNKVVSEYLPRYGQRLADEVRNAGAWIKEQAGKELAQVYPRDPDGANPITYLWARTIRCEGPGCGAVVPLLRSLWLARKGSKSIALRVVPNPEKRRIDFAIEHDVAVKEVGQGTVQRGSATCPICGFTTPVASVRKQLKLRRGGANDAQMTCVVTTRPGQQGRFFRLPTAKDYAAVNLAQAELLRGSQIHGGTTSLVPDEIIDIRGIRHTWAMIYGFERWGDLFTSRQALALVTLVKLIHEVGLKTAEGGDEGFATAVQTCLSLNFGRVADLANSLCGWKLDVQCPTHLFARQAIPMVWDFSESVCTSESSGSWFVMSDRFADILANIGSDWLTGTSHQASATAIPLPDDSANAIITDPPYYDAVPYAYLSDFFYVWLKRNLGDVLPLLFSRNEVPKEEEIVVDRAHELSNSTKDIVFYERELTRAFEDSRRVVHPSGIGTIVFASKSTASWEAILKAVIDAGWIITGSWPIDTEMETRVSAQGQARLASSVHLVCRPREHPDGSLRQSSAGDWRDILQELPIRIHAWLPRLAEEGVVGADAIFACLGPALEVFSRHPRVEKASGEIVTLREYLEQVWAAVAKEALSLVFRDADTSSLEPDARLTAMWLWTLNTSSEKIELSQDEIELDDEDEDGAPSKATKTGFVLEFDAARKIAQGLGANLEHLTSVVEVKGQTARLLPVGERVGALFGKDHGRAASTTRKPRGRAGYLKGMEDVSSPDPASLSPDDLGPPRPGTTVLDRVHQSMLLFGNGRSEDLKRFVVEEGAGNDPRFWKLAQSLSALYPTGTDEKRWVDGVLTRKKGLGF